MNNFTAIPNVTKISTPEKTIVIAQGAAEPTAFIVKAVFHPLYWIVKKAWIRLRKGYSQNVRGSMNQRSQAIEASLVVNCSSPLFIASYVFTV